MRQTAREVRLDERKLTGCSLALAEQPDDLAANGGGCDRILLRGALTKPNINPNGPAIRGCRLIGIDQQLTN